MLDPFTTKVLMICIALAMYFLALNGRQVRAMQVLLCFGFFCLGAPLGYDTLMYSMLISAGGLSNYGPLWSAFALVADVTTWWSVHLVAYVVITAAFVKISDESRWPSLLLATLTTLPGLGFDFLSVMRQGLCTAFIIFFYLDLKHSRFARSFAFAALAFLAHPAGLVGIAGLILIRFRSEPLRVAGAIVFTASVIMLASVLTPDFFNAQWNNALFLLARYVISDATIENETGNKLFVAWSLILGVPVLFGVVAGRVRLLSAAVAGVVLFLFAYALLLAVSGSSVRLIWLFLPMLMASVTTTLLSVRGQATALTVKSIFILTCFLSSAYVLGVAPEFFWADEYPHEVHFVQ